jgi:hypothetical protein
MTDTPWTIERRVHFHDDGFGRGKNSLVWAIRRRLPIAT